MLGGRYRVLDLTDETGAFCGKMLAELGLDVVKIEPPSGSTERKLAPFYADQPGPENSLYWFAFNRNKRGITLNLHTEDGRAILRRLAARADFLVESFAQGHLDSLGIGFGHLTNVNPRLIVTSITPFGQTGPRAGFAANDLIILAIGGLLNSQGDPDRPPLRFSVEQTYPQAGAQAAAATMIAHRYRSKTGRGQHVDVSMQEAICAANFLQQHSWDIARIIEKREGMFTRRGRLTFRMVYPCLDGFISWRIFVAAMADVTQALVDWMVEEGAAGELAAVDFRAVDMDELSQEIVGRWEDIFGAFFLKHTKTRLFEESLRRGGILFPQYDTQDLLDDRQLRAHSFWVDVPHRELGIALSYPGSPYRSTLANGRGVRRAPLLGEHNAEILGDELGLSVQQLAALKQAGVI